MKRLTLKVSGVLLLAAACGSAQQPQQQVNPYSQPSGSGRSLSSSSSSGQSPSWPGSVNQQTPTAISVPTTPTATTNPPINIPTSLPNVPLGQSPLTTHITAAPVALGSGDLMEIAVLDTPEVSGHFRVNADGEITMPLIGTVHVKGLAPEQAQTLIARKLVEGNFIKDPQVTIFVSEYATQMVYVLGEVKMPGPYPLMGSHRLLDFVSAAGGLTPTATNEAKITFREDPAHPVILSLRSSDAKDNPEMHPGDSISIEQAGLVYVLGDVNRAGGFLMDRHEQITLLRALALAQGASPTAAITRARLIRTTGAGHTESDVNLKKIVKGETTDPVLQAGDIVWMPSARTIKRSFDAIIQGATTASIYAAHP